MSWDVTSSSASASSGPLLTIETLQENKILEVTYDGQEIPQPPLTMSENLAKLASSIDWSVDPDTIDDDSVSVTAAAAAADTTAADTHQQQQQSAAGDEAAAADQRPSWPWESVHDKVRNAYTELCVLCDILSIARHKRYMVLDAVTQDAPEPRLLVQVISKKKALQAAVQVLMEGSERLRDNMAEQRRSRVAGDFYTELQRLRQRWRVRRAGSAAIVGNLSYKQAGSQFWLPGTFEVRKSDQHTSQPLSSSSSSSSSTSAAPNTTTANNSSNSSCSASAAAAVGLTPPPVCPLSVVVPSELQGSAHIRVLIKQGDETLIATSVDALTASATATATSAAATTSTATATAARPWVSQLESAQNVLFCRELIAHLACEAVDAAGAPPHLVVGNRITSHLFADVTMTIELAHRPADDGTAATSPVTLAVDKSGRHTDSSGSLGTSAPLSPPIQQCGDRDTRGTATTTTSSSTTTAAAAAGGVHSSSDNSMSTAATAAVALSSASTAGHPAVFGNPASVLEHSLHQLLRQLHTTNRHQWPAPHPASAPLGASRRRRAAGPGAMSRAHLLTLIESETILERIVRQARHAVLRHRTATLLESWASASADHSGDTAGDPLLTFHWLPVNAPEQSCCKVHISTHGYDAVQRTSLLITVQSQQLRCVTQHGRVVTLDDNCDQLRHLLLCQVVQHNIVSVLTLCRMLGWHVVSSCINTQPSSSSSLSSVTSCSSSSCQLLSPGGQWRVTVLCWPEQQQHQQLHQQLSAGVEVTVARASVAAQSQQQQQQQQQQLSSNCDARKVDWARMEGRNLLSKLELLLASLSSDHPPPPPPSLV